MAKEYKYHFVAIPPEVYDAFKETLDPHSSPKEEIVRMMISRLKKAKKWPLKEKKEGQDDRRDGI